MTPDAPPPIQRAARRARYLEWITLAARASAVILLGFAAQSQAVQALWIKNILALLPPTAFLVATHLENRPRDHRFPFGLYRVNIVAHLVNGMLLTLIAGYLLYAAAHGIAAGKPPPIGRVAWPGAQVWEGWLLIAALVYSGLIPLLLGYYRRPLARTLHDKALYADSIVGQAEWQSSGAAIIGLLCVHAGLWWADFAATGVIALQILRFGTRAVFQATRDLLGGRPREPDGRLDPLPQEVTDLLQSLAWVTRADVRLREEGRLLTGEARLQVAPGHEPLSSTAVQAAMQAVHTHNWRLHNVAIIPLPAQD